MKIPMRVAAMAGTALVATALAGAALAAPAAASVSGDYASSGVRIRTCPHTNCTALGLGYPGQGSTIYCFVSGDNINGNPYWDYNTDRATGVTGDSADYYMDWTGVLYPC
jgi:hypothetical protein